jgi:predicted house-cleaning noncanonical NTP pyrophosphatase (MazG superfamily)
MTKKFHRKLVRDKILKIIRANGAKPDFRVITDNNEYLEALIAKLVEETKEVVKDPGLEELADTSEVIRAIVIALGHTQEELEEVRIRKAAERGGFEDRIYLISTEE